MKYLNQFVQGSDVLDRLRLGARQVAILTRDIRAAVPTEFAPHVVGCVPRKDVVVILVDAAAWATQLRYLQQELLATCRRVLGGHIRQIRFKILPPEPVEEKPSAAELSFATRHLLQSTADGIADDELAKALRLLAREENEDGDQDADA